MTTEPIPKILGKATVVAGSNDRIDWYEEDQLGVTANLNTTITAGDYWPSELALALKTAMEAASDAGAVGVAHGGNGVDYAITISDTTGLVSIAASGAGFTPRWYPKITVGELDKLLTGGDANIDTGAALTSLQRAPNHFGWNVDGAWPAAAVSHTSDVWPFGCFWPDEPPSEYTVPLIEKTVRVSSTPNGSMYHADYSGQGKGIEQRRVGFQYQTEATQYLAAYDWWKWYASTGGLMRYYPDRTVVSYTEYKLVEESCQKCPIDTRLQGYAWFSGTFIMQRAWS